MPGDDERSCKTWQNCAVWWALPAARWDELQSSSTKRVPGALRVALYNINAILVVWHFPWKLPVAVTRNNGNDSASSEEIRPSSLYRLHMKQVSSPLLCGLLKILKSSAGHLQLDLKRGGDQHCRASSAPNCSKKESEFTVRRTGC